MRPGATARTSRRWPPSRLPAPSSIPPVRATPSPLASSPPGAATRPPPPGPADPLARPELDTTGAGDAFAAGFLAARGRDALPAVCLRDGHALAAAACRTTGGRPEA